MRCAALSRRYFLLLPTPQLLCPTEAVFQRLAARTSMDDDVIEHTLYVNRSVKVYRIPPRPAAGGHRSGEWRVADELFNGEIPLHPYAALCSACVVAVLLEIL